MQSNQIFHMKFYKRILVCGDRNWTDYDLIKSALEGLTHSSTECIIEGEALGADTCAREAAMTLNLPVLKYRAKWEEHGKAAGPIRNQQMIDEGDPDLVLVFHDDLPNSKGSKDMVRRARKHGLPVFHYMHFNDGMIRMEIR